MRQLYPAIEPFASEQLAVDDLHTLYLEQSGNPTGIPVLFLHGGPGAGTNPQHRRYFDPNRYRILLFDQRGCGKSTPHACLERNTTQDLVFDIERIRNHLGIDKWLVFGGSWGSTLALAYAQTFPARVAGLVLRGIFLCRREDIEWFYQSGASRLFPDYWRDFLAPIAESERNDLVCAYYRILTGPNPDRLLNAAMAWSLWEARTATLLPDPALEHHFGRREFALSLARIECHYFMHDSFLKNNQLVEDAHRLRAIPGVIVHGRYDVICPLDGAFALHEAWPESKLLVIANAGHSASEAGIVDALVTATDRFASDLAMLAM